MDGLSKDATVSMTDLSRSPAKYFKQLEKSKRALLAIKNSEIKYAVMNIKEYEKLIELKELIERSEIAGILEARAETPKEEYLEADIDSL